MNSNLSTFASGLIFGLGFVIAQMTNPSKVKAFLDVAGNWDPTLALVMFGALLTLGICNVCFANALSKFRTPTCKLVPARKQGLMQD